MEIDKRAEELQEECREKKQEFNKLASGLILGEDSRAILDKALRVFRGESGAGKVITSNVVGPGHVSRFLCLDDFEEFSRNTENIVNKLKKAENQESMNTLSYKVNYGGSKSQLLEYVLDKNSKNQNVVPIFLKNINHFTVETITRNVFTSVLRSLSGNQAAGNLELQRDLDRIYELFKELQDAFRQGENKREALGLYQKLGISNFKLRSSKEYEDLGALLHRVNIMDDDLAMEKIIELMTLGSKHNLIFLFLIDEVDTWFSEEDTIADEFKKKTRSIQILFERGGEFRSFFILMITPKAYNLITDLSGSNPALSRVQQAISQATELVGTPHFGDSTNEAVAHFVALYAEVKNEDIPTLSFFKLFVKYLLPDIKKYEKRKAIGAIFKLCDAYYRIKDFVTVGKALCEKDAWPANLGNELQDSFTEIMGHFGFDFVREEVRINEEDLHSMRLDGYFKYPKSIGSSEFNKILVELKLGKRYDRSKTEQVRIAAQSRPEQIMQIYFGETNKINAERTLEEVFRKNVQEDQLDKVHLIVVNNLESFYPLFGYLNNATYDEEVLQSCAYWLQSFSNLLKDIRKCMIPDSSIEPAEDTQENESKEKTTAKIDRTSLQVVQFMRKDRHKWMPRKTIKTQDIESILRDFGTGVIGEVDTVVQDLRALNLLKSGGSKQIKFGIQFSQTITMDNNNFYEWLNSSNLNLKNNALA